MECPFSLELPEENDDPMHDPDENLIVEKPKPEVNPNKNFEFEIKEKMPLVSQFDETNRMTEHQKLEDDRVKEITIDDD